jgi:peptidoglycan-associated lipoprotein
MGIDVDAKTANPVDMKHSTSRLLACGAAGMVMLAASCAHKAPAAASAPPAKAPVPVADAPSTRPAPVQTAAAKPAPRPEAPKSTTMTQEERTRLNENLAKLDDALFDYNEATIRPDAMKALQGNVDVIRGILAKYPQESVKIEGHADERGSAEYNLALGDRRAQAAKEFLSSMGIPASQLTIISYGKERPVCDGHTEDCWQRNRRAHLVASGQ